MTQTHDEELVERVAAEFADCHGQRWDRLTEDERRGWRNEVRMMLDIAEPLITHKAKEEGKAELLKQMMEHMERERFTDCKGGILAASFAKEFIEDFATEQGINIENGADDQTPSQA